MTRDRASVVANTLIGILARHLRDPATHQEITAVLREEFEDIRRSAVTETRPEPPSE
jgi:hypothetical protein